MCSLRMELKWPVAYCRMEHGHPTKLDWDNHRCRRASLSFTKRDCKFIALEWLHAKGICKKWGKMRSSKLRNSEVKGTRKTVRSTHEQHTQLQRGVPARTVMGLTNTARFYYCWNTIGCTLLANMQAVPRTAKKLELKARCICRHNKLKWNLI